MTLGDFSWKPALPPTWQEWRTDAIKILDTLEKNTVNDETAFSRLADLMARLANTQLGPLEQIQLEKFASRLSPHKDKLPPFRPLTIGIISNRTLDLMAPSICAAGLSRLLLIDPVFAPFDSADAFAYGRASFPEGKKPDVILLWQDLSNYVESARLLDDEAEAFAQRAAEARLASIIDGVQKRSGAPVIVPTLPFELSSQIASVDGAIVGVKRRMHNALNQFLRDGAKNGRWLLWDLEGFAAEIGLRRWFDPARYYAAKTPFSVELCSQVGDSLARILSAYMGKARRALVLDLDNTLWGGVIGEDGLDGIRIGNGDAVGEAHLALQQLVKELRRRGVVLAVCSKNDDDIARLPFRKHPDMALREHDIAVFQAGWDDKATAINAIAETLRLGHESLVFLDDNPAERARVRQSLPFVAVPEIGADAAYYPSILTASGYFEHGPLNLDDVKRADAYQAEAKRAEVHATIGDYDEYLRSLHMTVNIAPFDSIGMPRIAQLISKSNQFNFTTRRHSRETLEAFAANTNYLCWQSRLSDTFGELGMIAVVIVDTKGDDWIVDTWLQSCRILERGVEQTLMNCLVQKAHTAGAKRILMEYAPTQRNGLLQDIIGNLGLAKIPSPETMSTNNEWFAIDVASFTPLPSAIAIEYDGLDLTESVA